MFILDLIVCDTGGLIPPREGRVRAKRGGGEKPPFLAGLSPPGRSHSLASTLPSRGGMAPPMTQVCPSMAITVYSIVMPLALIMAPHCSTSVPTNFCRYSGVRSSGAITVTPAFCSRSTTTGVLSVSVVAA